MAGRYDLRRSGSQFFWNLKAENGERILTSEMYNTKQAAEVGIYSCRVNSPHDGNYDRRVAANNQTYFVLKAANGEIIGRGETYSSVAARESGIASCKVNGPSAVNEDNT